MTATFTAKLRRPVLANSEIPWAFVLLPKSASDTLPRRGRTSVVGSINGCAFQATLEPDGHLSHWLLVDQLLLKACGASYGEDVKLEIKPVDEEHEPTLPDDLRQALTASPTAKAVWDDTTTIARLDWIHWIVTAKQAKTREKRIVEACDKLTSGQRRVCCFDPSGFYSKALKAPQEKS